jgi:hypothetical protein
MVDNGLSVQREGIMFYTTLNVDSLDCREASNLKSGCHSNDYPAIFGKSYICNDIDQCKISTIAEKDKNHVSINGLSPKGRLKESLEFWRKITSDYY